MARPEPNDAVPPAPSLRPDPVPRPVRALPPEPFAVGTIVAGRPIRIPARARLAGVLAEPPRVALEIGRSSAVLLDATTGAVLTKTRRIVVLAPHAGIARVWLGEQEGDAAVRLTDGVLVTPRPKGPDGQSLSGSMIIVDPAGSEVWLFARDATQAVFGGPWSDLSPECTLRPFPFWPEIYSHPGGLQVSSGGSIVPLGRANTPCARMHLSGGEARCRAVRNPDAPPLPPGGIERHMALSLGDHSFSPTIDARWAIFQAGPFAPLLLADDETHAVTPLLTDECEMAHPIAIMGSPPRALLSCFNEDDAAVYWWTPAGPKPWLFRRASHGQGRLDDPVLPAGELDEIDAPSDQWIDVERGIVWQTEMLRPLEMSEFGGLPRRFLATRPVTDPRTPLELVLVDLEHGTTRTIATYDDCAGDQLHFLEQSGDRVALGCEHERSPNMVAYVHRWTEIVDLAAARRWRTPYMPEALLPGNRVLASARRDAAAETTPAAGRFVLLELQ